MIFFRGIRLGILLSCLSLFSCSSKVNTLSTDKDIQLDSDTGYLFLTINSDFNYSRFSINGPQYIHLEGGDFYKGKNYYLVPVESGKYLVHSF
ncbi:MAG: hypothetical protein OQK04_19690, partial [Kangiellaceae bacterium]|nr:hypothetical protein [Kangiellaceae bacterium]